ncbi:hypothetical protein ACQR1K_09925 [Bradyrhizobium sp. HKCCYLRH3095]|uniref:hypothetical protein n=1 Tax=Bradyrhizobium sp. HKCCYLRH3095 TaxID=3420765 RepID=UPI003EB91614
MSDAQTISIPVGKLKALWWVGGALVSIAVALVTTTLYINDLLSKISRLEKQVAAINAALSFEKAIERKAVTFNGNEEDPKCGPGMVMRGVRISYKDITSSPNGSIDCISLTPRSVP